MTIDVIGLGPSATLHRTSANFTIGVNDAARRHRLNALVLADPPARFPPDRLRWITGSGAATVFSHYPEWGSRLPGLQLLQLAHGRGRLGTLDAGPLPYSNNSTFLAAVVAHRLGARIINLWGVDLSAHPVLGRDATLAVAVADFVALGRELRRRGVALRVAPGGALCSALDPVAGCSGFPAPGGPPAGTRPR